MGAQTSPPAISSILSLRPRCVPDPITSVPSAGGDLLLLVEVAYLCEESVILYRMKKVKCGEKHDINFLAATQRESMKLTRNY